MSPLCFSKVIFLISELSVGMTTEGIEVRSVGNTKVMLFVTCLSLD